MPYWRLFYHLVWATNGRRPLIGMLEEDIIRASMKLTMTELDLVPHAIGMMPDHVHLVASIPPKVAVSDVVRSLKGASTHALNEAGSRREAPTFAWQAEYGAVSFGEKQLPDVIAYVENQPQRHADRKTWPKLEQITEVP